MSFFTCNSIKTYYRKILSVFKTSFKMPIRIDPNLNT